MKLLTCKVQNFCSYKSLEFDFRNLGLTLVYGATGSGKSTLQDIPAWILFGVTAKGGAVDEVISWQADGEPTIGTIRVAFEHENNITITRIRGTAKDNDLYWQFPSANAKYRGKDLADTQKQINERLGTDASTFCAASYFNEASDTNNFFLAKAKDRREVFERVADLELPKKLAEKASEAKKVSKSQLAELQTNFKVLESQCLQLEKQLATYSKSRQEWDETRNLTIKELELKTKNFDKEKESKMTVLEAKSYRFESEKRKKIDSLVDGLDALHQRAKDPAKLEKKKLALAKRPKFLCTECKRPVDDTDYQTIVEDITANSMILRDISMFNERIREAQKTRNPYTSAIEQVKQEKNNYQEQLDDLKDKNPFDALLDRTSTELTGSTVALAAAAAHEKSETMKYSALGALLSLSSQLRGALLRQTIRSIESNTNNYLTKHFDSEFKVLFSMDPADDSIAVQIFKNSYNCVYSQLSKGQRQLLRLCFSISVMQATQNNSGVSTNLLCFDEALDGLDQELKIKAFTLFEELAKAHESIMLIDHNLEFQSLFSNRFHVELVADESQVISE